MNVLRRRKLYVDNVAFIVNTPALKILQSIIDELPENDRTQRKITKQLTLVRDMIHNLNSMENKDEAARIAFILLKIFDDKISGISWKVNVIPELIMSQSKAMVRTKFKLNGLH